MKIINDPSEYYKKSPDLFFEYTISESLSNMESPYLQLLEEKKLYSEFIFNFLKKYLKIEKFKTIIEIGGGYGKFMKNFLQYVQFEKVFMVDISKKFLEIQKQALSEYKNIEFIESDGVRFIKNFNGSVDLIILNEVIGDFKTLIDVSTDEFGNFYQVNVDYLPKRTNINIGALDFVNLAAAKCNAIFFVEHSSTYEIPSDFSDILIDEKENFSPKEIKLMGHSEYSINFRMLQEVSEYACFKTVRKHLMDVIPVKRNKIVEFVLKSNTHQTEFHEIIDEFYNHIKEYEVLLCYKG